MGLPAAIGSEEEGKPSRRPVGIDTDVQEGKNVDAGGWTPQGDMRDRRTFFHTTGKTHTFGNYGTDGRTEEKVDLGTQLELNVEDVHFGNARVHIMQAEPAPMPK